MSPRWGPDPALVSSSAHVFVDSLEQPLLDVNDSHHLSRVLRLRDGEQVSMTDGQGRWRSCTFQRSTSALSVTGDIVTPPRATAPFGVAVSVPKGDRIDWIVQKLTELGTTRIVLLRSDHSVVRWDLDQASRQLLRLQSIARAAAMQSRRLSLPQIEVVQSLDELLAEGGVAVAMLGAAPVGVTRTPNVVAVGPEGGWSPREYDIVAAGEHETLGLGTTVLRTDTAAIVAGVLLAAVIRSTNS